MKNIPTVVTKFKNLLFGDRQRENTSLVMTDDSSVTNIGETVFTIISSKIYKISTTCVINSLILLMNVMSNSTQMNDSDDTLNWYSFIKVTGISDDLLFPI